MKAVISVLGKQELMFSGDRKEEMGSLVRFLQRLSPHQ